MNKARANAQSLNISEKNKNNQKDKRVLVLFLCVLLAVGIGLKYRFDFSFYHVENSKNIEQHFVVGTEMIKNINSSRLFFILGKPLLINNADENSLSLLPGIGHGLAKRIVDYRNEHGDFTTVNMLTEVPGLGSKKISQLADLISFD